MASALESKKAATLILGTDIEIHRVKYKCNSCNQVFEKLEIGGVRQEKHDCGGSLEVVESKDMLEELVELAEASNTEIVFVSNESSYGKEFTMGYAGIGALLRYK